MFGFLVYIFNNFLYYPLLNSLVLIYNFLPGHDLGLAIIFLTVIIRFVLYPLSLKALHSQRVLQSLQPKLQEIQRKYKDDKEKQARETLELYRKEKMSPFGGLFLALIQLPILLALYNVFLKGLNSGELNNLYSFVSRPESINYVFLGLVDLSKPNFILALLAGIMQFWQVKMLTPSDKGQAKQTGISSMMQKQMLYFFPIVTVVILSSLPSALGLYWVVSGMFSIIQQYFALKKR